MSGSGMMAFEPPFEGFVPARPSNRVLTYSGRPEAR